MYNIYTADISGIYREIPSKEVKMPIIGMTDQGSALPEIGQIRKGAPKGKGGPGKDLTYFRVVFNENEAETAAIFTKVYGNAPREINILLPLNEIDRVWEAWYEAYIKGMMVARADGEKYIYKANPLNGDIEVKNGKRRDGTENWFDPRCIVGLDYAGNSVYAKPVGRLKVIVPELRRLAYMTVITGSKHDIVNISKQLEAIRLLNDGQIAGIPLVLRRRPKSISTPTPNRWASQTTSLIDPPETRRVRRVKWLLSVEVDPKWVKAKLKNMKDMAMRPEMVTWEGTDQAVE
jgi:hypothetical protein